MTYAGGYPESYIAVPRRGASCYLIEICKSIYE